MQFVAETQVQREPRCDLVVVLHEKVVGDGAVHTPERVGRSADGCGYAQEEIGEIQAGVLVRELEITEQVARLILVFEVAQVHLGAKTKAMFAGDLADGILPLIGEIFVSLSLVRDRDALNPGPWAKVDYRDFVDVGNDAVACDVVSPAFLMNSGPLISFADCGLVLKEIPKRASLIRLLRKDVRIGDEEMLDDANCW